jgi:hypothetical protein
MRPSYFTDEQRKTADNFHYEQWLPYQRSKIAQLKQNIPQVKVIEIFNSHHSCFISDENLVYEEMRKFLMEST